MVDQVPVKTGEKIEIKGFSCKTGNSGQRAHKPQPGHKKLKPGWTSPDDQGRVRWSGRIRGSSVTKLSFSFRIVRPKDWLLQQHGG